MLILNVGWSNKGNVAIVKSTIENIKAYIPDAEFILMGNEIENNFYHMAIKKQANQGLSIQKPKLTFESVYYLFECVLWSLFKRFNYKISKNSKLYPFYESEIIINSGGDTLSGENGIGSLSIFFNLLYAILLGKHVVLYGESLGYFDSFFMNYLAKFVFNRTTMILTREELSKVYLDKIGIKKPKICVTADPAFNLKKASTSCIEEILHKEGINSIEKPLIVINPSGMISRHIKNKKLGDTVLVETVSKAINNLIENNNINIILLPHVYSPDGDDRRTIDLIFSKVNNKSRVYVIKGEYSPEELKGVIALSDLFIGMRMHSMIAATSLWIPTVAIAYSHKTKGVIGKMLGQEEYILDINDLDYETLISKINAAWDNREQIKNELAIKIPQVKEKSMENGKLLKDLLDEINAKT